MSILSARALRTAAVFAGLFSITAAQAQGSRPPGEGVICAYGLYTLLQFSAKVCDWDSVPFDDALEEGIVALELYILANAKGSSIVATTRANMLAGEADWKAMPPSERRAYCEQQARSQATVRATNPSELRRNVNALVSVSGEPTLGSCL